MLEEKTGAIGHVNGTVEQKTEIKQVSTVGPVRFDYDVSVGVAVPRTVEVHPLSSRSKTVPAYEHYEYFVLADGRIAMVESDTPRLWRLLRNRIVSGTAEARHSTENQQIGLSAAS